MANILYISYDGMTDPLGESQVIPYLKGITEAGHNITLISAEKKVPYQKRQLKIEQLLQKHNIDWHPIPYHYSPPLLSTILDYRKIKRLAVRLHKKKDFKIIHCRSYISALVGLHLKKVYHTKFIFDMRGFWADERVEGGVWNLKNPIFNLVYRFFKKYEVKFLSKADYTISLTNAGKKIIHNWTHIKNQPIPIEVIPCCTDFKLFNTQNVNESKKEKLKKELGITTDDFIISYLGSIGTWYMLDEMLDFFKVLISKKRNAKFLFITRENKEKIIHLAESKGISQKSVIITSSEREDVPSYLSLSNASIFFIKPVFSKKASSPTKQGELMGLGLPLICNSNVGDVDSIIKKEKTGYAIEEFSTKAYEKAIVEIEQLIIHTDKETIINEGKLHYDVNNGIKKYVKVYEHLLQENAN